MIQPMTDDERNQIYEIIDDWYHDIQIAEVLVDRLRNAGFPIVHWSDIIKQVVEQDR